MYKCNFLELKTEWRATEAEITLEQ